MDVLVEGQVGLFFQVAQVLQQGFSLWCLVVHVLHRRPEATFRRHHDVVWFFKFSKSSKIGLVVGHFEVPSWQGKLPGFHIRVSSLKVLAQVALIHIDFPELELSLMLLALHDSGEDKFFRFLFCHLDVQISLKV